MAEIARETVNLATEVLMDYDEKKASRVLELEAVADRYEDMLGAYLVKLSSKTLSAADSQSMSVILHSISDLERITDHAKEVVKSSNKINIKGQDFSPNAKMEVQTLARAVNDICNLTIDSFCGNDRELATHVEPLEEVIDTLTKTIKDNHVRRLKTGKCSIEKGFLLEDILNTLERISDHCSKVAVEMITIYDNEYNTHEYFKNFSGKERENFNREYEKLLERYPLRRQEAVKD